ncbi:helix-turn-helix domain-containing protein [Azospirillum brasilense]|nr:helix-turn-helix domain-containing protein [Azospirillum brasilense]NUB30699.1 helix-turn-helix domain-containing protein [Azospirillum brasilense]RIW05242.1 XRE family transcriptional regulator [Azospirillum brasilense]
MSDKVDGLTQRIGERVRIEREGRGWSLSVLATHSGVSRAMVHKLEHGGCSPTATLLARLAGAFGLSMSQLIARAEMQEGRLVRQADQPIWTDPQSGYVRRHVSPPSDMPLDLVHIQLPPGAEVPMPALAYVSRRQLIWVLNGSLVFIEGNTRHQLGEGDCLELGSPADCVFKNETLVSCNYAVIVLKNF